MKKLNDRLVCMIIHTFIHGQIELMIISKEVIDVITKGRRSKWGSYAMLISFPLLL
jgi:hypothetical protein